jgi:hypothetical protein
MDSFKEWINQQSRNPTKAWKAKKQEVIQHWQQLPPSLPLANIRIIPTNHKGKTYSYDGLRITGSSNFINAVISRLKDLLSFEGQGTRLQVQYRQQVNTRTDMPVPHSYIFYAQVKEREKATKI